MNERKKESREEVGVSPWPSDPFPLAYTSYVARLAFRHCTGRLTVLCRCLRHLSRSLSLPPSISSPFLSILHEIPVERAEPKWSRELQQYISLQDERLRRTDSDNRLLESSPLEKKGCRSVGRTVGRKQASKVGERGIRSCLTATLAFRVRRFGLCAKGFLESIIGNYRPFLIKLNRFFVFARSIPSV